MIRASGLSIAQHCGHASVLSAENPQSSEHSIRGDVFHLGAQAAEVRTTYIQEAYKMALASVDEGTRVEISDMLGRWLDVRQTIAPEHVDVEMELALDADGIPCAIDDVAVAVPGHQDIGWVDAHTSDSGTMTLASSLDHKTGQPRDHHLQTGFYGIAYATLKGATHFRHGCAYHRPGQPPDIRWSPIIPVDSPESEALWQRILAAASKGPEPVTGAHCGDCFQRMKCRAHLAPAMELAHEALRPIMMGGGGLTKENAPRALRILSAMQDVVKMAKAQLESFADQNDGIGDGNGRVWRGRQVAGRMSVDVDAIKRDGLYEKYSRRGDGYTAYSWGKK